MQQTAPVTPDLFWETMTGYQRSEALKAAVDLEVFTKIAEGSKTARKIAAKHNARVFSSGVGTRHQNFVRHADRHGIFDEGRRRIRPDRRVGRVSR